MEYGHFDDDRREYVVTRPDTPLPWMNYLGTEDYFGLISNTAGGCSFYRDARLRRLTRYRYNNAPLDLGGRYLYLRDDLDGDFWSPTWQPTRSPLDAYECRHGLSYTLDLLQAQRHSRRDALLRASRRVARDLAAAGAQRTRRAGRPLALLLGRVLPLGRPGRRHELPAQLQRRRGRGGRRGHLPQDRVPGAPRPLRLLRLLGAARRLRHPARRLPRRLPGMGLAPRCRKGQVLRLDRPRLGTDGLAPRPPLARAVRDRRGHIRPRLLGEHRRREVRPARDPRRSTRRRSGP